MDPPPLPFFPNIPGKKKPGLSSSGILIVWQLKKWLTFPEFTGLRRIIRLVPWQLTGPVSDNVARCSQVHNVFTGCLPFVLYQLRAFLTCFMAYRREGLIYPVGLSFWPVLYCRSMACLTILPVSLWQTNW